MHVSGTLLLPREGSEGGFEGGLLWWVLEHPGNRPPRLCVCMHLRVCRHRSPFQLYWLAEGSQS